MTKQLSGKTFLTALFLVLCVLLAAAGGLVAYIDPFFHYHTPNPAYYYTLDNERSQNDGILKHFEYDAVITGTSVTENFKTSECDALFGTRAVKTCYAGATFKEIRDNLETALSANEVKLVIRSLDDTYLVKDKDAARLDLGEYPTYLYNDNPFDDIKYLCNRDVIFGYCVPMLFSRMSGRQGGITSFDEYANWMEGFTFGHDEMVGGRHGFVNECEQVSLTDEERELERANIEQNVASIAREHPETTFYLFFSPYSVVWWGDLYREGRALAQIEAQELAAKMLLPLENVRLFSFHADLSITAEASNYRDAGHYGEWINSAMLKVFAEDDPRYRITEESAEEYFGKMREIYLNYDYASLTE